MKNKYIFGGYYLVQGVSKPTWISDIISSKVLWSLTDCISNILPSYPLLPGCESTGEMISEISNATGLSSEEIESMKTTVDDMLKSKILGWPNVFYSLESAQLFCKNHLCRVQNLKILGIGFPKKDVKRVMLSDDPIGSGSMGLFDVLSQKRRIPSDSILLGFEILGLENGGDFHSFLCNGLEKDFSEKLSIKFNKSGRIETLTDAKRAEKYMNDDSVVAEPVPWFKCLVFEQPLV